MQVITWNVRGANGRRKQLALRRLRCKFQMNMVFIQETKIRKLEDKVVEALWGGEKFSWFGSDAEDSSGGLLTIWEPDFLQLISKVSGRSFTLVHGTIKENQLEVTINFLNVYAPNTGKEKMLLWESLVELKASFSGEWVIGGDFNSVLLEEERSRSTFNGNDANLFQDFIQAMEVLDLPLKGRRFTWGNTKGASRLDRFLVSPRVLSVWPKIQQVGLEKGLSDHVAVSLGVEEKGWGYKPFRVLNAWLDSQA
ncbi:hypothetical protein QQ045_029732 [Rhodiola kirilowii]